MSEYTSLISDIRQAAPSAAVGNIDANPDEAARALELEKSTGTPASAIFADPEPFERQHQAELAGQIVRNNSFLRDYIDSHPMAAPLSNGDYGNLDEASSSAQKLAERVRRGFLLPNAPIEAGHKLEEGFGQIGSWLKDDKAGIDLQSGYIPIASIPLLGTPVAGLLAGEIGFRALSAGIGFISGASAGAAKDLYFALTGDEAGAARFARDIGGAAEMQLTGTGVHGMHAGTPKEPKISPKQVEALRTALPWFEEGREPPAGLHPEIDKLKAERNVDDLKHLDDALSDSTKSATRERAPDMYAGFMRQHFGDGKIGISGDRIAELYGDKLPHPEDNLLGWVPGIKEQLEAARETGQDIQVPIADWLARVEPDLAKELHDDIRVRPGNITKAEAETKLETTAVEAPLAQVRAASALEPMFSIGDRKLTLARIESESTGKFGREQGFHDFSIDNENGDHIGTVNISTQKGGKQLYIDLITGINGLGPRDFGPSLMRDLLRQLKAEFPEAESITGHRASGARWNDKTTKPLVGSPADRFMPVVKLDKIDAAEVKALHDHLIDAYWERFGGEIDAALKPTELYTKHEQALVDVVNAELKRIAPKLEDVQEATSIEKEGLKGTIRGAYIPGENPTILWSLNAKDAVGVARHEAIHYLKERGFFTEKDWVELEWQARNQGWFHKYDVDRRYSHQKFEVKLEEAVAEAFRDWAKGKDAISTKLKEATGFQGAVERIFRKLQDLMDAIGKKFKEILGHEPTWEELFESTHKGEIGSREGKPAGTTEPKLSVEDRADMLRANATGLDLVSFKRIQKQIQEKYQRDYDVALKRAEREETIRQSKEWKDKSAAIRPEVVENIKQRPDVALDLALTNGEINGRKGEPWRLRSDDLTPEQTEKLPRNYFRKDGFSVDEVAEQFGFTSRESLVESLVNYNEGRRASGKNADLYRRQLIDEEVQRRMERDEGFLQKNILEEAIDRAFSEADLNILIEEYHAAGIMAKVATIDKAVIQAHAQEVFAGLKASDVSFSSLRDHLGKLGRETERALIAGKPAEALKAMERRVYTAEFAKMARELEKDIDKLNRTSKVYLRAEPPKGVERPFVDHIQQLLRDAGYKTRMLPEENIRSLEHHGERNLTTFVSRVEEQGWGPKVSEELQISGAKRIDEMSVAEFGEFKEAIDTLNHIGRKINKIIVEGNEIDYKEWKSGVIANIKTLPKRTRADQHNLLYQLDATIYRTENILRDLDLHQPHGPLTRAIVEPMGLSKAKEYDLAKEIKAHFDGVKGQFDKNWRKDLGKKIEQDLFYDPHDGGRYDFNREMLLNVMLHWGNESNIQKMVNSAFAAKYERLPTKEQHVMFRQAIDDFLQQHALKEDWQFVQGMWEPFKKYQPMQDTVIRNTSGIAPKWIEPGVVKTAHGEFEGGYWPIEHDKLASSIITKREQVAMDEKGLMGPRYARVATAKGHLKDRTSYVGHIDITSSVEQMAGVLQQMVHDISYRDSLIQAQKILGDSQIRQAITEHYGIEYSEQLMQRMRYVAYAYPKSDPAVKGMERILRWMRLNLVQHALPFSAAVTLSPDVGVPNPVTWGRFTSNFSANKELAMEKSAEIRHLVYNIDRDYNEVMTKLSTDSNWNEFRKKAIEVGYYLPTKMSQFFRMSTFVDKYNEGLTKGMTDRDASLYADTAVRTRHGAQSPFDLPPAFQGNEYAKMMTIFGGFFNTQYNWLRQLPGQLKRGEYGDAAGTVMGTVVVGTALNATLFNKWDDKESWWKRLGKAFIQTPLQNIPGVNQGITLWVEGHQPRMPLASFFEAPRASVADIVKMIKGEATKKPISHTANVVGLFTGMPLSQFGRSAQFMSDVNRGKQRPRSAWDWFKGLQTGEMPKH